MIYYNGDAALWLNIIISIIAFVLALGETRLSFGDKDALQEKLNIRHGAVSFLARYTAYRF